MGAPRVVRALTLDGSPLTATGTRLSVVELFPSSPKVLAPQHRTAPAVVNAQVCSSPARMALTPDESEETATGTWLSLVELFPS
jgi:hypothetical protein